MNALQKVFNYQEKEVRTVIKDGEPWFVAKDVCEILEIEKYRDAVGRINNNQRGSVVVDTLGGMQEMTAINEAGVYKLVFTSRKPEAEKFTDWLAEDVIPSIRKTGTYLSQQVDSKMLYQIAQALEEKEKQILLLGTENKLLSQENLTWTNRKLIEALVKKLGGTIGYETAWREFKKELLYKHSINLNARLTAKINSTGKKNYKKLDMIHDEELSACISTAVALCKASRIEIAGILNKFQETA